MASQVYGLSDLGHFDLKARVPENGKHVRPKMVNHVAGRFCYAEKRAYAFPYSEEDAKTRIEIVKSHI